MKEQRDQILVVAAAAAAADGGATPASLSPSPISIQTPANFTTPSLFSSRRRRPWDEVYGVVLRLMAVVFSFVSALSLAIKTPSSGSYHRRQSSSFAAYPQLLYCFGVAVTTFVYSALQTFKGVCDVSHRGVLISDSLSDYISFIFDQMMCYLLISSSSVAIARIEDMDEEAMTALIRSSIVSASMSLSAFFVLSVSALFSGYRLCKRFIW